MANLTYFDNSIALVVKNMDKKLAEPGDEEDDKAELRNHFYLIDISTPESLERDFYAWLKVN